MQKSRDNFFIDKERIRIIDKYRLIYLALFVFFYSLTEAGRFLYRPYIYENNINDYGLADSIGNLGGICVQIFFGLMILNSSPPKGKRLIAFFTLGYIIYEALQLILPKGVFDWYDVAGTVIGGVLSLFLYKFINEIDIKNKTFYKI